jgi:hypothetical protein
LQRIIFTGDSKINARLALKGTARVARELLDTELECLAGAVKRVDVIHIEAGAIFRQGT